MSQVLSTPLGRPVDLSDVFNATRAGLPAALHPGTALEAGYGEVAFWGLPFLLGGSSSSDPDVIHLTDNTVHVALDGSLANWLVFLHCVEDIKTNYLAGFADDSMDGNSVGDPVAEYTLVYADGSRHAQPIRRRFAIQQLRIGWGASAFEAVPHRPHTVDPTMMEAYAMGVTPRTGYGYGEVRHNSGRQSGREGENLWVYAMPNPYPGLPLDTLELTGRGEEAAVLGLSLVQTAQNPLRWEPRRKLRVSLPPGLEILETEDVLGLDMDMGMVISARPVLVYDPASWKPDPFDLQPAVSTEAIVVEYAAHPDARLYAATKDGCSLVADLAQVPDAESGLQVIEPASRPVKLRFRLRENGQPIAVRLHLHGAHGEYLPPRGGHRRVNGHWFEDNYGEFVNGANQYAYVHGDIEAELPLGPVYLEAVYGLEALPHREVLDIGPETEEVVVELDRVLRWREQGWVSADTHVHFLSPTTALLEGAAEGLNVVNLLASQWGEMFSNVTDFDGATTLGARDFGGDGEYLVRVGTENRMHVLGHVSLLGYSGEMIHPLCTGGPNESAIGDAQEVTMAQWSRRCIEQGGLVISPHGPNPQGERAADVVLGLVHGIEMMVMNPYSQQISRYGIADWYRFLNLGYHIPVVGGSDKMMASALLGGVRTYANLGAREFTYENWMDAVRDGDTFVTIGPLVDVAVEGQRPGTRVRLPASGGTVAVEWTVESVRVPIHRVEVIVGGRIVQLEDGNGGRALKGACSVQVTESTWIAVRVRGTYTEEPERIAAHSSAIMVTLEGLPHFNDEAAVSLLAQIEGTQAYLETIATRPDEQRFQAMRLVLEQAYNRLHQRMHARGIFHRHPHGK